ncbi:hypothetical protein [Vibrio harveyi]|uniref:hypothetical protein n=1 Tax=Vibrio harveyi TaxID=669 RepID=UPI003D7604C8
MSVETNLPRAVVEQNERAEALIASINESNVITENEPPNDGLPLDAPTKLDPESTDTNSQATSESNLEALNEVDQLIADAQSVNTDTPIQQPASTPIEGSVEHWQKIAESWEHKYQVLAGKYNKEIVSVREDAALRPEFDQLKQEKAALEQQIQALQLQLANQPKEQPTNTSALESQEVKELLTHLSNEYGDDLVNGFAQLIKASEQHTSQNFGNIAEQVQAVSSSVEDVKRDASATSQQQAQQLYTQKVGLLTEMLSKTGIDFKKVDDDPLFHEWLAKYDAESGKQRQRILMELFHSGELESVAGIYVSYIKESGTGSNVQTQQKPQQQNIVDFNEQVQVQSTAPKAEPEPLDPNIWTNADIKTFYEDVTKGRYSAEEIEKFERQIFAQLRDTQVS